MAQLSFLKQKNNVRCSSPRRPRLTQNQPFSSGTNFAMHGKNTRKHLYTPQNSWNGREL